MDGEFGGKLEGADWRGCDCDEGLVGHVDYAISFLDHLVCLFMTGMTSGQKIA